MVNDQLMASYWEYVAGNPFEMTSLSILTSQDDFLMYKHISLQVLDTFGKIIQRESADRQWLLEKYHESVAVSEPLMREQLIDAGGIYIAPEDLFISWVADIQADRFNAENVIASMRNIEEAVIDMKNLPSIFKNIHVKDADYLTNPMYGETIEEREAYLKQVILRMNEDQEREVGQADFSEELTRMLNETTYFRTPSEHVKLYLYDEIRRRINALRKGRNESISESFLNLISSETDGDIADHLYKDYIDYKPLLEMSVEELIGDQSVIEGAYALLTDLYRLNIQHFKSVRSIHGGIHVTALQEKMKADLYNLLKQYIEVTPAHIDKLFHLYCWSPSFEKDIQKLCEYGFYEAIKENEIQPTWEHRPLNRSVNVLNEEGYYIPITWMKETNLIDLLEKKVRLTEFLQTRPNEELLDEDGIYYEDPADIEKEIQDVEDLFKTEIEEVFRIPIVMTNLTDAERNIILFEKWFGALRDAMMGQYMKTLSLTHDV